MVYPFLISTTEDEIIRKILILIIMIIIIIIVTIIIIKDVTILWDMPINTDKEIKANRPDIVIKDKSKGLCTLIDMSVPSKRNASTKEVEKIAKYKDLDIEISKMWSMKTNVIPIVIGALGLIRKGINRYVEQIPGNIRVEVLQMNVLLGTAHLLSKTLSVT